MNLRLFYYLSPVGILKIEVTEKGLKSISKTRSRKNLKKFKNSHLVKKALDQYFSKKKSISNLPLDVKGTSFQKKVWNHLKNIPIGDQHTYSKVARSIGHPKAVRAVGTACGKNPCLLVIPCHRVISKTGLGGFSAGLAMKNWLIRHEMR